MIQKVLTKYWLAFHVLALFVVVSLNLFGVASMGDASLFWLSLLGLESLLLLPTVFKAESLAEARKRVLRSLEDDAFLYVGLLLVAMAVTQWLNSGCTLDYFSDADVWKYRMPPLEWLPYSVTPRPALELLSLVTVLFVGILIIRNGLGKGGRRFLLESIVILGGVIGIYCTFKSYTGVLPYVSWRSYPDASNIGTFFGFLFLISLGRDLEASSQSPLVVFLGGIAWWLFAFVGNLVGFLQFSDGVGIFVFSVAGIILFIYRMSVLSLQAIGFLKRARFGLGVVTVVVLVVGAILVLLPASPVKPKLQKVLDSSCWTDSAAGRQLRATAAMKIWEEALWTGVGPQGFSHYLGTVIEDGDWKTLKEDRRYVWNDFLQFLSEWGVIGSGLLLAIIIILLVPLFVRLRNLFVGHGGDSEALKDLFLSLDAYFVPGVFGVVILLVYGWWSSLFQNPLTFLCWFFVLALVPGLLPSRQMRKNRVRGGTDE